MYEKYFVNQKSSNDCGIACLAMILKMNNEKVNYDQIKKEMKLNNEMASVYDIIKYSSKRKIEAQGYKNVHINDVKTPCIMHIVNGNIQHFIVVLKVLKNKVLIADPASRIMYVKKSELLKKYTGIVIFFKKKTDILKTLLNNKKKIIRIMLLTFSLAFLSILTSITLPYGIRLVGNNNKKAIVIYLLFIFIVNFLKTLITYFKSRYFLNFEINVDNDITIPLIKKMFSLPHEFYHQNGPGKLISLLNDLSYVKEVINSFIEVVIINVFLIISIILVLTIIKPIFVIINLFYIIIFVILNRSFLNQNINETYDLQLKNSIYNNYVTNLLSSILFIKNLSKEAYFKTKVSTKYKDLLNTYKHVISKFHKKKLTESIITTIFIILCLFVLINNKLDIFVIIFCFSLQEALINSLNEIFNLLPLYSNFKATYKRINELYKQKEILEVNNKIDILNIKFKNVKYYNNKMILKDVSFEINKGDWVMINGPVGSGKSTIFKLLTKELKYNGSGILINNKPINKYSIEEIRNSILYVDQKQRLLNDSIKENVFMGDDINENVLLTSTFNTEKNLNYDYVIDNTNSNISSGQLNKLFIASALNSGKDIIIFDETTCNLDEESENKILNNIKNNYKNKTIIFISHNKTNTKLFDKVITIRNGKTK